MKKTTSAAGAAAAAAATMAAAAGAYYLYGSEKASQNRRKVSAWMRRAEREIVYEAKRLKDKAYTDANVKRVIEEVAKRYETARDLDPKDVKEFISAVKESWQNAGKAVKGRMTPKTGVKKAVKKAVKRAVGSVGKVKK